MFASEDLIKQRLKACDACDKKVQGILGPKCAACGCPIVTKVALVMFECPLKKWVRVSEVPNK